MLLLQADLIHRENGDAVLLSAATKLTELDSVEEDGILQWWEDERSSESEDLSKVREKTRALVEFLQQESEDESEEESDEDSE
jgi:translation initiation factor eIF-2B subunit epsilon